LVAEQALRNNHKMNTVREMNTTLKVKQGTIKNAKKFNCLEMAEKLTKNSGAKLEPNQMHPI